MTLMGKEQELLPCPLCSQRLTLTTNAFGVTFYTHTARGCVLTTLSFFALPENAAAWNRRSSSDEAEVVATGDLRAILERLGRSQAELSHVLGSRSRAAEYLNGQRPLNIKAICKINAAWGVSADELLGLASPSGVKAGVTEAMVEAAAEVFYTDYHGRHGGPWKFRDPNEVIVIQAKATASAALTAALGVGDEGMGPK